MSPARLRRPPLLWIGVGLAVGILAALLIFVREPGRTLTREGLDEARERWQAAAPASYRMEIETAGATAARHEIEVREGAVAQMTTGGTEAARSAWEYWTVEGLFRFLESELANARDPRRAFGVEPGQVVLRVRFHPRWGYPEFFLRHVMGRRQSIEWRVKTFESG